MQLTIRVDKQQLAGIDLAATSAGQNREEFVLRAIDHMLIREKMGPKAYAEIAEGLADDEAGRYASKEAVDAVFREFGAR